jgi:hypothetical protein
MVVYLFYRITDDMMYADDSDMYFVSLKLRAIYKNDPDKSGYYGNDPENVFITK